MAGALAVAALAVIFIAIVGRSPTATIAPLGVRLGEATPTTLPPEPRLEAAPGETADFVRSREDPVLTSYGWVDQKNGVVRLPIQQAMNVIAQKGLPSRPANTSSPQDQGLTAPGYPSSGRYPEVIYH